MVASGFVDFEMTNVAISSINIFYHTGICFRILLEECPKYCKMRVFYYLFQKILISITLVLSKLFGWNPLNKTLSVFVCTSCQIYMYKSLDKLSQNIRNNHGNIYAHTNIESTSFIK